MGAAIITSLLLSGFGLYVFLTLPAATVITGTMGLFIMLLTIVFLFSFAALIIWTDHIREFYNKKRGPVGTLIKIITFPIWLFGIVFCAWGAYETAKGVRNWMHKSK